VSFEVHDGFDRAWRVALKSIVDEYVNGFGSGFRSVQQGAQRVPNILIGLLYLSVRREATDGLVVVSAGTQKCTADAERCGENAW
jgi:hypothetical protein